MTDEMPLPELIDVTDRVWSPIAKYLPHSGGKVHVGFTNQGINPEVAKEQVYDAFKAAKKSSGNKHLDPLMKHHMPQRIVNAGVADLLGGSTVVKGSRGKWYIVKNFWASKLGWARRKVIRTIELPRVPRRNKRRRII
jgi:hypothetical protein